MEAYDIIFRGDLVPGHQLLDVKQQLAALFKTDAAKIDQLFSGAAVPLKRNLDKATAEKYQAVLHKAGAQVQLKACGGANTAPKPSSPPVAKTTTASTTSLSSSSTTLKERLAQQALKDQQSEEKTPENSEPEALFSLAPLGADLQDSYKSYQPAHVMMSVSDLDLRPATGHLVDEQELVRAQAVEVAELMAEVREAGADLLDEDEKPIEATLPVADLSADLAPVGSDMGQLEKPPAPPAPDTSAIRLQS